MIRKATLIDLDDVWKLRCQTSQLLKRKHIDQWQAMFPTKAQFHDDIMNEELYVLEKDQKIIGMMALKKGVEPTYETIYDGCWHHDSPYFTIHRFAIDEAYHGLGYSQTMLAYAKNMAKHWQIPVIRIDTHEHNKSAIRSFTSFGFQLCGYILLAKTHPTTRKRLAFDLRVEDYDENISKS